MKEETLLRSKRFVKVFRGLAISAQSRQEIALTGRVLAGPPPIRSSSPVWLGLTAEWYLVSWVPA